MSTVATLTNFWETLKEADLQPLRQQALRGVRIAIIGRPGSGRATLADQMRRAPHAPQMISDAPVLVLPLEAAAQAAGTDLVILVVDSRLADSSREQELVTLWHNAGWRVLVLINQFAETPGDVAVSPWVSKGRRRVVWGSVLDSKFLLDQFVPAVVDLMPEYLLPLGRHFPLFRQAVGHELINDACFSNTAYALSTGLAEMIPVVAIPLTLADMVILTKTQLFLVYKLGLALGYSTRWQDYVAEFGGVLGSGFVWRQLARSLVGLVPVVGILPKTAVAYAGTYVVGQTVYQWCMSGKHLSRQQMQQLYLGAFERGKMLARGLALRTPRLHLPRVQLSLPKVSLPRRAPRQLPVPQQTDPLPARNCPACGKANAPDASFCQYCGRSLAPGGAGEE